MTPIPFHTIIACICKHFLLSSIILSSMSLTKPFMIDVLLFVTLLCLNEESISYYSC